MRVSHLHTALAEPQANSVGTHTQVISHPSQGQALGVQVLSLVDVSLGETTPPRCDALTLQDLAYSPAIDPEPVGELVDCRARLVSRNQVCDLLVLEPPGGAWRQGRFPLYRRCVRPRQ